MTTSLFLVRISIDTGDLDEAAVADLREAEGARSRELAAQGALIRVWRTPRGWSNVGLWAAHDEEDLMALLSTLPLRPYMTIEAEALSPHPNDPGADGTER